jgi:DNA-binding transcriptional LysR family regulator
VNREADLAFLTIGVGRRPGVVLRVLDRHPLVLIMAPNHHLAARVSVPVAELRGERFIGVSSGVNNAFAKDLSAWLTRHMGEPPRIVASEPPDQIASAVATSGGAVAVMTETRALVGESVGIVYRKLAPTPMIEYGIAFRKDNPSQPLADFIKAIDDSAPTITDGLLAGYEAVSRSSPARAASQNL